MKTKLMGAVAALALLCVGSSAYSDSFFPIVNAGDTFSGQMTIDPTVPFDPTVNYYHSSSLGMITVNLGGGTFSEVLTR
jgi:hypothetical protein